jgi:PurA ssDNA and RNA-binding protein
MPPDFTSPSPLPARPLSAPTELRLLQQIQIERKAFLFTVGENPRGKFLKITEDVQGRRDTIIVPATGLAEFRKALEAVVADLES